MSRWTLSAMMASMILNGVGASAILTLRAINADRALLATTGDLIVLFLMAAAGAFVTYAAMCGGARWDADRELRLRKRQAERAAAAALSVGAMSPNEARDVVNLADHRREP